MARADDYANWIVNNADKKGTPEFDTVVAAYQDSLKNPELPKENAFISKGKEFTNDISNLGEGLVGGAADIGNTLINASTFPYRKAAEIAGYPELENLNKEREAGLKEFYKENEGNIPFSIGRIASNIAGTAGASGILGATLGGLSSTTKAAKLAEAIRTSGMADVGMLNKVLGGATSGAIGSLLIDPESTKTGAVIGGAIPIASAASAPVGSLLANIIGGIGTHTGGESLKTAAKAGLEGGEAKKALIENMRGKVPMQNVLDTAKQNLQNMAAARSAAYRSGMADISKDATVLNFNGIDDALNNANSAVTYKGQIKNAKGADILGKIQDEINQWKMLDPAQFHTPEGLDALKQKVGGIVESIPFEEKTARMIGSNVYNSIKNEITKQAPTYAKVMGDYSDASSQLGEIERALSLGNKASIDTAMRKLQSLMRNNVSTNYGNRLSLAKSLEEQGGNRILPALAGQSLNSWTPRGLGGAIAGATGIGGIATLNPYILATLLGQSPRLVGETALKAGQLAKALKSTVPYTFGAAGAEANR